MSKQNNLTDFLTDIANSIRNKKGTTAKINPQNFSQEIRSIETYEPVATDGIIVVARGNDIY